MTYIMTKPCPVCTHQLTKQKPTDIQCAACVVDMFGRDSTGVVSRLNLGLT